MALITEQEAKTKWCPHARATDMGEKPLSINRRGNAADPECLCLASACMAWRWGDEVLREPPRRIWWPETDEVTVLRGVGPDRSDKVPASAQWVPLTGGDEADDHAGAYWEEAADEFKARVIKARDSRRGFCGAFGTPAEES